MMRKALLGFLLLVGEAAWGATLLPNGQQQFIDANGKPYNAGKVWMYSNFPTCSILKNTWQNEGQTVLNTNPITLDSAGRATIFGSGAYCQVLKDSLGNTIWTKYTADTSNAAGVSWGGTSGGTGNAQTLSVSTFTGASGQTIYFIAGSTNTGATTLTVSGITAAIVKTTPGGVQFLTGGELVTDNVIGVTYVQSTGQFQLVTTNLQQFGQPTDIPAGATVDLNLSQSHVVNVTGSSTISSFGSGGAQAAANSVFFVKFNAANTITYNATSLKTPTGADMSIGSGDSLIVVSLGGANWQVLGLVSGSNNIYTNAQTGTTYTLLAKDAGKLVTFANTAGVAVTVPQAGSTGFPAGFSALVQNVGTSGVVTLTPTTSTINGQATLTLGPGNGLRLVSDGTNWQINGISHGLTQKSSYTVSGTPANYDFTGLPVGVKRITLSLRDVTISGANETAFQFIVGGSPVATGYDGGFSWGDNAILTQAQSNECIFSDAAAGATNSRQGVVTITNVGGNLWTASGTVQGTTATHYTFFSCGITLAGAVTGIRVLPTGGTLAGGTIGLMYE